jgi:hypothetical protein
MADFDDQLGDQPPVMRRLLRRKQAQADQAASQGQAIADRDTAQREAQANRVAGLQSQAMGIAGQRQLARDRFGYDTALGQQSAAVQTDRDAATWQHDDELFDRHQAGRIAEMQLEQLHKGQQDQFAAESQQRRDDRLQGYDVQKLIQQQQYDAQRQEQQQNFESDRLGQQQQYEAVRTGFESGQQQDRLGQQQDFEQQQQHAQFLHSAALNMLAQRGREAEEEIVNRHKEGTLAEEHGWKVDQIKQLQQYDQDKLTAQGLEAGSLILDPAAAPLVAQARQAKADIASSPVLSDADRQAKFKELDDKILSYHRTFARPQSAAEKGSSYAAALAKIDPELRPLYEQDPNTGRPVPSRVLATYDANREKAGIAKQKMTQEQEAKQDTAQERQAEHEARIKESQHEAWDTRRQDHEKERARLLPQIEKEIDEEDADIPIPKEQQHWYGSSTRKMTALEKHKLAKERLDAELDPNMYGSSPDEYWAKHGGLSTASAAPSQAAQQQITPQEFDRQWTALPPGGKLVGPDGKTYVKKGRKNAVGTP